MRLSVYSLSLRTSAKLQGRLQKMPTLARRLKQEQLPRVSKTAPARASVLFIVANVDFNDYFTRKVRKDMSAHLADTKTQTALTVLLAFGGSSDVQYSIKSLGLGKNTAQELWGICSSVSHFRTEALRAGISSASPNGTTNRWKQ